MPGVRNRRPSVSAPTRVHEFSIRFPLVYCFEELRSVWGNMCAEFIDSRDCEDLEILKNDIKVLLFTSPEWKKCSAQKLRLFNRLE